jgi:hypothetical protein
MWQTSTRLLGATTQKTAIIVLTAVRTSNPTTHVRFEVLTEVKMAEISPEVRDSYVPQKRWFLPTSPQGVNPQKTNIDNF